MTKQSLRKCIQQLIREYVTAYEPQSWASKPPMFCVYDDDDEGEQTYLQKSEFFNDEQADVPLTMGAIEDPDPTRDRSEELDYFDLGYPIDPTNFRVK